MNNHHHHINNNYCNYDIKICNTKTINNSQTENAMFMLYEILKAKKSNINKHSKSSFHFQNDINNNKTHSNQKHKLDKHIKTINTTTNYNHSYHYHHHNSDMKKKLFMFNDNNSSRNSVSKSAICLITHISNHQQDRGNIYNHTHTHTLVNTDTHIYIHTYIHMQKKTNRMAFENIYSMESWKYPRWCLGYITFIIIKSL